MARRLAADLVINTGQASQALAAFGNNLDGVKRQAQVLGAASNAIAGKNFGLAGSGIIDLKGGGQLEARVEAINRSFVKTGNTIKTVSQLMGQFIDENGNAQRLVTGTVTSYEGNVSRIIEAQGKIAASADKVSRIEDQRLATVEAITQNYEQQKRIFNLQGANAQSRQTRAQADINNIATARQPFDAAVVGARGAYDKAVLLEASLRAKGSPELARATAARASAEARLDAAILAQTAIYTSTQGPLDNAKKKLLKAIGDEARAAADSAVAEQEAKRQIKAARLTANLERKAQGVTTPELNALDQQLYAARTSVPELPRQIQYLQGAAPNLLRRLEQAGLGQPGGAAVGPFGRTIDRNSADYVKNLISQEAYEGINIQRDLVRQVTRVSGSFKDATGLVQTFNAEFDAAGRTITRFGSQMSGLGTIFSSLKRDFQKVLEFAIATTVVFGAFRAISGQLNTVIELDKSIRQLSVTANQTRGEATKLFASIADAAIATATPLEEMVKAADDIALATRKAGQSADEWNASILSLSTSVGILTNLAGIDTVRATDLLVSTMKQLNLEAADLPGVLNKVTAVAGGQSAAIADVITGLGNMAEASRQAGLSLDETIGAVQALSQATSKSPAEVATSFKNLVGALGGPSGVKALDKFDIALRNTDGSLRNILEVYGEIQDKIQKGIIPQSEVQGLIRGIAGGPRRAPDAAALLSVIKDIGEAARRSAGATNDAFLANAKVLDTVQAKLIQIQARMDKFAVGKFGTVIREVSESFLDAFQKVLDLVEVIPSGLITFVAQIGALAVAVKLAASVGKIFLGTLLEMGGAFRKLKLDIDSARGALAGYSGATARANAKSAITKGLIKSGGAAAIGGAIGAAAAASGGASPLQIASSGLETAGLTLLFAAPIPHAKLLGGALLAVGTGLSLVTEETKKSTTAINENSEAVLNNYGAFHEASIVLQGLEQERSNLNKTIQEIELIPEAKRTTDQIALLTSAETDYANATRNVIEANNALNQSFEALSDALSTLPDFPEYEINLAKAGLLNQSGLENLIRDLSVKFIQQANPDFQPAGTFTLSGGIRSTQTGFEQIPSIFPSGRTPDFATTGGNISNPNGFNLKSLATDAQKVKELFSEIGEIKKYVFFGEGDNLQSEYSFLPTPENLDRVRTALYSIREEVDPEKFRIMATSLDQWAASVAPAQQLTNVIEEYSGYLSALEVADPFVKPEDIKRAREILLIYSAIAQLATGEDPRPSTSGAPGREGGSIGRTQAQRTRDREEALKVLNEFAFDSETNQPRLEPRVKEEWLELAKAVFILNGEYDKANDKISVFELAKSYADAAGESVDGLTEAMNAFGLSSEEAAQKIADLQEAMNEFADKAQADLANRSAELAASFQAGDISETDYNTQNEEIKSQVRLIRNLRDAYNELAETQQDLDTSSFGDVLGQFDKEGSKQFIKDLRKIPGLEDAASLSTFELIQRMSALAETYGLTGDQTDVLGKKLSKLFGALQTISKYRAKIGVGVEVDVGALIKMYKALNKPMPIISSGLIVGYTGGGAYSGIIKELEAAQTVVSKSGSSIGNIYRAGTGGGSRTTSGGGGSSRRKGKDVSTVDLPDEIADAYNRSSLIREAIKRARALQRQIPGATKDAKNDIVELLKGTQRILEVRGVKDDYLRKALEELADIEKKRLEQETKADVIRRIRVGGGDFSAIANVPVNSKTGISLGGADGPINITLNMNGTVLTPAQFDQFANQIAAALKRQLAK